MEVNPQEPTIVPIGLVSLELPAGELVATGLLNRPELAEAQSLVCEAVNRYRRRKMPNYATCRGGSILNS